MRLKSLGTKNMQLFVNNEMLPAVKLDGSSFAEYEVALPDNVIKAGENQVLFRFGGTTPFEGQDVAAAIDYVRLVRGADVGAAAGGAAPKLAKYETLVRDVSVGDEKRKALVTSAGTVSFYVEVPEKASLSLRFGQASGSGATAKIRITPEGKPAT